MKKSQLKQIIKPIVKECINEVLLEQGLLSNVVTEVVKGLSPITVAPQPTPKPLQETNTLAVQQQFLEEQKREMAKEREERMNSQRKKILKATGLGANIFEGVEPLGSAGTVKSEATSQAGALAGVDSNDPGVDITGIMALGSSHWKKMMEK
tara:strand:- start:99 stop:554 length:456 start_codon:yes stop_codon:yes gene_type:complete